MSEAIFVKALFDPTAPTPDGLLSPKGAAAGARFDVYRNNVTVSLIDALSLGFPATQELVGKEFFTAMAREFICHHPPDTPVLALYGAQFPAFINGFPPAHSLPYLSDVARLDYELRLSYHAEDHSPLPASALTATDMLTRPLNLSPATRWFASTYPVTGLHAAAFGAPPPQSGAETVLITRPDFDPHPHAFPPGTERVLNALKSGRSLSEATELAPRALDLTTLLTTLMTGQAFSA